MMQPTFSHGYGPSTVWSIKDGSVSTPQPARSPEGMTSQGFCLAVQTTCKSQVASGNRLRWPGFAPWEDGETFAGWTKGQQHELQKRWRRLLVTAPPEELATWGERRVVPSYPLNSR